MGKIQDLLSNRDFMARIFRWFWVISLAFLLVGYTIIILRLI